MRYKEIFEAPISDITYQGDFDHSNDTADRSTSSYPAVDKKLVKNEKYKARLIKAFQKTPFDFEVAFVDIPKVLKSHNADSNFAYHLADYEGIYTHVTSKSAMHNFLQIIIQSQLQLSTI